MKNSYAVRFVRLFFGLVLCAVSVVTAVQGNVGVSPWDVFHQGMSSTFGMTLGQASMGVGIGILLIAALLGEKVGAGTICNIVGVGIMMDAIMASGLIPQANSMSVGLLMMLLSVVILAFGSYFYISAALGCGPRDSMMSALSKRFPKIPVGIIRAAIEAGAILCGWIMGGQAGVGTVVAMGGIGFAIQFVFRLFHFNLKEVQHESCFYTLRALVGKGSVVEAEL